MPPNTVSSGQKGAKNPEALLGLGLFILTVSFYACLPVVFPPEGSILNDSVEYATQAESTVPGLWFHPHHILNNFIHRGIWLLIGGENSPLRVIHVMRWTSHISMGLAIMFLFFIALRLGAARMQATLLALVMMVGCSPWVFGSVAEVVGQSAAIMMGVFWGLFYRKNGSEPSLPLIALLGFLYGLAITINQTEIIYLPAFLLAMLGWRKGYRIKPIVVFNLVTLLWSVSTYLFVSIFILQKHNLDEIYGYLTTYAQWNAWGKGSILEIKDCLFTLFLTQSYSFQIGYLGPLGILSSISSIATIALVLGGFWGWLAGRDLKKSWQQDRGWLMLFLLIAFAFYSWWTSKAWDYWVLPWGLLLLGFARLSKLKSVPVNTFLAIALAWAITATWNYGILVLTLILPLWVIWKKPRNIPINALLVTALVITGGFNFFFLCLPRNSDTKNPYYRAGELISELPKTYTYSLITTSYHLKVHATYWGKLDEVILWSLNEKQDLDSVSKKELFDKIIDSYCAEKSHTKIIVDDSIWNVLQKTFKDSSRLSPWLDNNSQEIFEYKKAGFVLRLFSIGEN